MPDNERRLIIVSNRVPYNFTKTEKGLSYKRSIGGLVTALDPVMSLRGGVWIGWNGFSKKQKILEEKVKLEINPSVNYEIKFVYLNENDINLFYHGFSNRTLWPLFHGFIFQTYYNHEYWVGYQNANKKYAKSVMEEVNEDDVIWIHDYHLLLVPNLLRERNNRLNIIFFLHIPFPNYEILRTLPWHKEILKGMLGNDLLGFQTKNDCNNFLTACERSLGLDVDFKESTLFFENRKVTAGFFPVSIDYKGFEETAKSASAKRMLQKIKKSTAEKSLILSVERLDYTKGIKERLASIERFFEKYPEYRKKVLFVQIAVPSRAKISEYIRLKNNIDELMGRINGRFAEELWSPILYIYKALPQDKLAAYYQASDVCLVTPLRDGMNLIAKEYVACKLDGNGILILSEFAGTADEFKEHAIMVNPYDTEKVADSINEALKMSNTEKKEKILALREIVKQNDVFKWCSNFLNHFEEIKSEN